METPRGPLLTNAQPPDPLEVTCMTPLQAPGPPTSSRQSKRKRLRSRSEKRRVGEECRSRCDWIPDVCSSDLNAQPPDPLEVTCMTPLQAPGPPTSSRQSKRKRLRS